MIPISNFTPVLQQMSKCFFIGKLKVRIDLLTYSIMVKPTKYTQSLLQNTTLSKLEFLFFEKLYFLIDIPTHA